MKRRNQPDSSDQSLLEQAIRGDAEAFGDLYARYLDEFHRYIYYRVANRLDAEDLTEAVFIKAWDALPRFTSAKVNFRAWLYRIAQNTIIDHYRARQATTDVIPEQLRDSRPSLENQMQSQDKNQGLALAIQSLDANSQQVIICRFINEMSHAETAEALGLNEGHVRILQMRALQKLRLLLEKEE
jgi:RNA polymerase sigma-70 factor (ECF subfamily)